MQQHRGRAAVTKTAEQLFGEILREVRKGTGFSQEQLAFESGYHPTYIGQLERGTKSPSLRTIMNLSAALNTTGSELLKRLESLLPKTRSRP
jgi:transcriptional regulator with XRE-family HTH domain